MTVVEPGANYWPTFRELVQATNVRGKVLTDAHIAALAIENKASVASADRDFARFPGVRVFNPLL